MRDNRGRQTRAGGAILAFSIFGGTIIGWIAREPSIGVVAGIALGLILLLLIWLWDRRQ